MPTLTGTDHLVQDSPAKARPGTVYLCKVPLGWEWRMVKGGNIVVAHPDHRPRNFDLKTKKWSEYMPNGLCEMDPQPD